MDRLHEPNCTWIRGDGEHIYGGRVRALRRRAKRTAADSGPMFLFCLAENGFAIGKGVATPKVHQAVKIPHFFQTIDIASLLCSRSKSSCPDQSVGYSPF
jgi:hypothetical protein